MSLKLLNLFLIEFIFKYAHAMLLGFLHFKVFIFSKQDVSEKMDADVGGSIGIVELKLLFSTFCVSDIKPEPEDVISGFWLG